MTFGSVFGRTFSPTFQPKSQAVAAAGGWWLSGGIAAADCIVAYQPKGAASYAASKVNLANPGTYDGTDGNAPTWDAVNGWTFDGSDDSIITGYKPTGTQVQSVIIRFSDFGGDYNDKPLVGYWGGENAKSIFVNPRNRKTGKRAFICVDSPVVQGGTRMASGVVAVCGDGTDSKVYADGSFDYSETQGEYNLASYSEASVTIGSLNGSTQYAPGKVQAFAIYDIDISSYVSALTTAMNAL